MWRRGRNSVFDKHQRVAHAAITKNKHLSAVLEHIRAEQDEAPPKPQRGGKQAPVYVPNGRRNTEGWNSKLARPDTLAAVTAVIAPQVTWLRTSMQFSSRLLMIINPTAALQSCLIDRKVRHFNFVRTSIKTAIHLMGLDCMTSYAGQFVSCGSAILASWSRFAQKPVDYKHLMFQFHRHE